jgi:hypothetical protein
LALSKRAEARAEELIKRGCLLHCICRLVARLGPTDTSAIWPLSGAKRIISQRIAERRFMIGFMFPHGVDAAEVEKYMKGLKRAQIDLDFAPQKYKHFYANEIPDRYKARVDVRHFSNGERIVFLPYSAEIYAQTQAWIRERRIFTAQTPAVDYTIAVTS